MIGGIFLSDSLDGTSACGTAQDGDYSACTASCHLRAGKARFERTRHKFIAAFRAKPTLGIGGMRLAENFPDQFYCAV